MWLLLKARIGFFDGPENLELLLPAAFEFGGYEAMLGIDRIVLPLGEADLILGPLALLLPMPVQAVLLCRLRLQHGVQGIEMGGLEGRQKGVDNHLIHRRAM